MGEQEAPLLLPTGIRTQHTHSSSLPASSTFQLLVFGQRWVLSLRSQSQFPESAESASKIWCHHVVAVLRICWLILAETEIAEVLLFNALCPFLRPDPLFCRLSRRQNDANPSGLFYKLDHPWGKALPNCQALHQLCCCSSLADNLMA